MKLLCYLLLWLLVVPSSPFGIVRQQHPSWRFGGTTVVRRNNNKNNNNNDASSSFTGLSVGNSGNGVRRPFPILQAAAPPYNQKSELWSKDDDSAENGEGDIADMDLSLEAFQKARDAKQQEQEQELVASSSFDGYDFRDVLLEKWGACFDVDFNRVDSFGFRALYLNILPYRLGRRPWRHASELDYLCHLQAVVEILQKYNQLDYVLYQIRDTKKKPIAGRSPIVAVPIRLDLTPSQVQEILGY